MHVSSQLRRYTLLALVLLSVGVSLVARASETKAYDNKVVVHTPPFTAEAVIAEVNRVRQEHNLFDLVSEERIMAAANIKAGLLVSGKYLAHYSPDGRIAPWDPLKAAGYPYIRAGENLARDFSDAQSLITAMLNSDVHRANLLGPQYNHIGVSVTRDDNSDFESWIVTMYFGSVSQ